ncbi:MAG: type II toxin-antitoxin system RelE/ParE family toxin [Polaromonas sp.]
MSYTVFFVSLAEQDLQRLRRYVMEKFSEEAGSEVYAKVRDAILGLENNPNLGRLIPELETLGLNRHRYMLVEKKNKVIFEIIESKDEIYVYLICQDREDFNSVLIKRLLEI